MAISRRQKAAGGTLPGDCIGDKPTGVLAKRPALAEFLSNGQFDDGSVRPLPTLLLFIEEGLWKACLRDKAEQEVAWTSDLTLAGLLDALERGLAEHSLDWRKQKPWTGGKQGK